MVLVVMCQLQKGEQAQKSIPKVKSTLRIGGYYLTTCSCLRRTSSEGTLRLLFDAFEGKFSSRSECCECKRERQGDFHGKPNRRKEGGEVMKESGQARRVAAAEEQLSQEPTAVKTQILVCN